MIFKWEGIDIYYEISGERGIMTFFLHGWGGSCVSFAGAVNRLKQKNMRCLNLDFAGFGRSGVPPRAYGVEDYTACIRALLDSLHLSKIHIVAHSFGGRVAMQLAANNPHLVERLVLVDSAGLKPRRGLRYRYKVWRYKRAKKRGKDVSKFGSKDFLALGENMRATFVKVVNQDLSDLLSRIRCETLIIWGANDKDTPLYMAKKLKKHILRSELIVFKDAGHYSYLDEFEKFVSILSIFLN